MGDEMMNGATHPSILFPHGGGAPAPVLSSAHVLIATVTRGQDESIPHGETRFLFEGVESPSPAYFWAFTWGSVFFKITRVGYNTII